MRALLLLLLLPVAAWADGGVILSQQTVGGIKLTLFGAPAPLRAGPVDVSLLVQEAGSKDPVLDATVDFTWKASASLQKAWMPPCCSMSAGTKGIPAPLGSGPNKLLYSAMVPISQGGPSQLIVHVNRSGQQATATVDITARPPEPPMITYWPWLAFPPLMILGFAVRQRLVRKSGGQVGK